MTLFKSYKCLLMNGTQSPGWMLFPDAPYRIMKHRGRIGIYKNEGNMSIPVLRIHWGENQ